MSIYTKTGDEGVTSLVGGERILKDDPRVAAYGAVDELSSVIGLLTTYCSQKSDVLFLQQVQRDLFIIGGFLAFDLKNGSLKQGLLIKDNTVCLIETEIDRLEVNLPSLQSFILPGGCRAACLSHVCRTICRRAEREIVRFMHQNEESMSNVLLRYVNRLSDYLFLLARKMNQDAKVDDVKWFFEEK